MKQNLVFLFAVEYPESKCNGRALKIYVQPFNNFHGIHLCLKSVLLRHVLSSRLKRWAYESETVPTLLATGTFQHLLCYGILMIDWLIARGA